MNKKQVVNVLEMIAVYLEIKGENSFKTSAYRRAAQALESDDRNMEQIGDPSKLKGIGKGTATVITELLETGKSSLLEELQAAVPSGLLTMLDIPGLGGKKIAKLYQELGVTDIKGLKEACEKEKVRGLAGFGTKTEEKILAAIEELGKRPERLPIAFMLPVAEKIEEQLKDIKGILKFSLAGSLRRFRETIKDLDFILAVSDAAKVKKQLVQLEGVTDIIAKGDTKVSLQFHYDYPVSVDFRLVSQEQYASALHHFTGSMEHNVKMRQLAKERNEKISEYGVENTETGEITTFSTEEEFYGHFGLQWIPPEVREGGDELEKFREPQRLIEQEDIQGDLHMHSTWSDGANTIEEMAEAAREKGYSFMAITDHSQYLRVANGLTAERLREQRKEIDRLNGKYSDFKILAGVEMDILPDGTLDFDDDLLAEMDLVIASIHSSFSQNRETIMKRMKTALKSHHVDIIAHPTGRIIGRRPGYDVDLEMLIDVAAETNTALELNAHPSRLDLAPEWLKKAQDKGVKITINTDAHYRDTLGHMDIGVSVARKGYIRRENVLNAMTLDELTSFLKRNDKKE
ncbi:DNA polymerase/3'-5' exonuclease PolX [Fictibacillus sp. WQ 8-8]|uniref:DNA polymerase/3'-5' exonuclease PolX n=1 Tax=Fictibacillus sp. WQ 8-8 TaxID=2938788 RepID=UPI00210ED9E8|nr:DNA polymerase/3'-5' exonuclease PolX [Fictibacillus sp. WQ 8-8]